MVMGQEEEAEVAIMVVLVVLTQAVEVEVWRESENRTPTGVQDSMSAVCEGESPERQVPNGPVSVGTESIACRPPTSLPLEKINHYSKAN